MVKKMDDRFIRNTMFWGTAASEKLCGCHIAVVGIGGVGSYAAEALARSGVGTLTLYDHDRISPSNINRQLCALTSTVGIPKAQAMAERVADINPAIIVRPVSAYYSADTRDSLFDRNYDYIIDAIDLVSCKIDLIESSMLREIPIISALGTGNKGDPSLLTVADIAKTSGCPFARVVRRELRDRGILHHKVVYSPEEAITPLTLEEPPPGRRSIPASLPWLPGTAGLMLAWAVILDLIENK